MKYIEIQNQIICLENIEQIVKDIKERYILIYYRDVTKIIKIDYENVKDNINDEKTEVEKDYERIKKELIPENGENKIKELENQIEMYKITLSNISSDISKYKQNLRNIVNSKEFSHKKIQKLKGVI